MWQICDVNLSRSWCITGEEYQWPVWSATLKPVPYFWADCVCVKLVESSKKELELMEFGVGSELGGELLLHMYDHYFNFFLCFFTNDDLPSAENRFRDGSTFCNVLSTVDKIYLCHFRGPDVMWCPLNWWLACKLDACLAKWVFGFAETLSWRFFFEFSAKITGSQFQNGILNIRQQ